MTCGSKSKSANFLLCDMRLFHCYRISAKLAIRKQMAFPIVSYLLVIIQPVLKNTLEWEDEDKIFMLTDDGFDNDVINAAGPVLVDFWAEWWSM